ncbi:hypothetical protein SAMN02746042_00135 [Fructilactobacillus lindneri DSM 20690 = JCM 11027]|nr:hypothetical protein [Fructilactobacillus lindneri]SJZ71851.1 hypothetical protein SAMN02746042_00135 [Fructilactobacillus lindneri DSM 20690 = JCM 11027]
MKILIKNAQVYHDEQLQQEDVLLVDGMIKKIQKKLYLSLLKK